MYNYSTITELSVLIKTGRVSPIDIVHSCLERIEKLNPVLNAFITINPEAITEAEYYTREVASGNYRGPLHGIPVAVKDFFDTAGMRTTAGFKYFKDRKPKHDAEVVKLLKEAGAIIIGKTNMHELGMGTTSHISYFGSVHNPWNTAYISGGSSGGSAAAVAAGLCFATIDTDAIGSCRLPASCCGVVGYKGSYGLISSKGILEGEKADDVILKLAHNAIMTRTVTDTVLVLSAVTDKERNPDMHFGKPKELDAIRVGVVSNFAAKPSIHKLFNDTVSKLKQRFAMTDIEIPFASASFDVTNIDRDRVNASTRLFKEIDIVILPTVAHETPTLKQAEKLGPQAVAADNTFFCNYFALPAISIPCAFTDLGLPIGFQVVGKNGDDETVINAAYTFEKLVSPLKTNPNI